MTVILKQKSLKTLRRARMKLASSHAHRGLYHLLTEEQVEPYSPGTSERRWETSCSSPDSKPEIPIPPVCSNSLRESHKGIENYCNIPGIVIHPPPVEDSSKGTKEDEMDVLCQRVSEQLKVCSGRWREVSRAQVKRNTFKCLEDSEPHIPVTIDSFEEHK